MANDYKQKAGDNSVQVQADVVNVGISEQRAREICYEVFAREASSLAKEAVAQAHERVGILEGKLISKTEECQDLLNQFRKPEFLYLVQQAEKSAIQTDRELDYDMLVNLLINKTKKENDRKFGTGVKQAIEIVNEIDDDSLSALSVLFVHNTYTSTGPTCSQILDTMENLYSKIGVNALPTDDMWMDQLDILKCIRLSDLNSFKKMDEYFFSVYTGLCVNGIRKDNPHFAESLELLRKNGLPQSLLVEHELNPGFVRLRIGKKEDIDTLFYRAGSNEIGLSNQQRDALRNIYSYYLIDDNQLKIVKENLNKEIEKREKLTTFRKWLEKLPHYCDMTCVGKVLAYTKAKIMFPDLPNVFID